MDVDEFAHLLADSLVEIYQEVPFLLEEWSDVVLIVFEERALAIGTLQGVPVYASPLVVVADAKVLDQRLVVGMLHRNGQCLRTVCRTDETAVAIGLLLIGVVLFYQTMVIAGELLIPLNGSEVGGL